MQPSYIEVVQRVSASLGCSPTSAQVAAYFDKHDKLRHLRDQFLVPKIADLPPSDLSLVDGTQECIYLAGNSLGLQPKMAQKYLEEELEKWAKMGVHGHTLGSRPWAWAEENIEGLMANVVVSSHDVAQPQVKCCSDKSSCHVGQLENKKKSVLVEY
uniref:Kynureninase n=1 Tax=Acanthochromis polyacanthus TaxID=80966 RepID=A0A3Q1FJ34_9TELE